MYQEKDYNYIIKNLSDLEEKAQMVFNDNYAVPSVEEMTQVYGIIKNYIRDNNLIVYGGYAQNSLIKVKNEKDAFYKPYENPDIEFYSYEPLKDLINICDILHKEGYENIEGKEGVHPGTYKIFVNFHNYTDFSYMPKNIFKNCPTIEIDGMKMTHPHFMLIDAYRVYSDPMTSYFRLTKSFTRMSTLMKYYPLNEDSVYNKIEFEVKLSDNEYNNIYRFIRKHIVQNSKLILIGFQAFNRLMDKAKMKKEFYIQEPYYQLISINYKKDKEKIHNLLKNNYKDIVKKEYYPYFEFFDETTEYYYKNQLILRLYGNNERCIVNLYSEKKKIHYGTIQLQILYLLGHYNIAVIRNNKFNKVLYMTMITRLLKARDKYINDNKITVLDKSPFQEFVIECMGTPVDPIRNSLLKGLQRKKEGKKMKFNYVPSGKPGKIPEYKFDNFTGDLK
jgi:hypothetical protein